MTKANRGPLENASIQRLFEAIINETRAVERYTMENESKDKPTSDKE